MSAETEQEIVENNSEKVEETAEETLTENFSDETEKTEEVENFSEENTDNTESKEEFSEEKAECEKTECEKTECEKTECEKVDCADETSEENKEEDGEITVEMDYEQLKADFEALKKECEELREFKASIENEKKNQVVMSTIMEVQDRCANLIDLERYEDIAYLYPNADDKIKLLEPTKYKTLMYDALVEMIGLGLITFTVEYNGKDFVFLNGDEDEGKAHMLSNDEKASYTQMDLLKEEVVNMYRFEGTNGSHRYSLPPDKERKMHDDRAYTLALLGYYLQQKRRDTIINPQKSNQNDLEFLAGYANLF